MCTNNEVFYPVTPGMNHETGMTDVILSVWLAP